LVVDVAAVRQLDGEREIRAAFEHAVTEREAGVGEQTPVGCCVALARRGPAVEVRELRADHGRLERIEPEVAADLDAEVLRRLSLVTEQP